MSKGPSAVAAIVVALCCFPIVVQAQFGISGGVALPQADFGKVAKSGYEMTAFVPVTLPTSAASIRFEASMSEMKYKFGGDSKARVLSLVGNALLALPALKGSYAIAGIGVYRATAECKSCSTKSTKGGINGGIGYAFAIGAKQAFLEARVHHIAGPNDPTNGGVPGANTRFLPLVFGITF